MKKNIKSKGMTLIEVVLAMTLLSVVSLTLFSSYTTTFFLINKKQKSIDNNLMIRLAKESTVDCIKEGKGIKSYNDINSDLIVDDSDEVKWTASGWDFPDPAPNSNRVTNLKIIDSNANTYNLYNNYKFNVENDNLYVNSDYPNIKKFIVTVLDKNNKKVKSFNLFLK